MTQKTHLRRLEPPLRRVLRDCRLLYAAAAQLMATRHPTELGQSANSFHGLMEDLHRGLLIKVYTEMVRGDGRWTHTEKHLGAILIEHIWDQHLRGAALRQAAEELLGRSDQLSWAALLAPFVRYRPLRDMVGQVETIVSRLANLIVKCDGQPTPQEIDRLHDVQDEVSRTLRPPNEARGGCHDPTSSQTDYLRSPHESPPRPPADRAATAGRRGDPDGAAAEVSAEQRLTAALAELDELVGLDAVKARVRSLSNFLQLQQKRRQAGLATMPISLHMAFVGNPGTGKTTVARIVGQILGAMGILSKGHLVETDRSGLVAAYAGQTAPKTNELCDSALDGVLFIDEAYSLATGNSDDAYGREALQTLLKRMEDDRQRLVVILAGYPDEMDQMIRTNPGLSSRINTRICFDDYSPAELGKIFETLCKRNDYRLPAASRHRLLVALADAHRRRDRHFGNGRLARNAFEDCVRRLADRIADTATLTEDLMTTLAPQDITVPSIPPQQIDQLVQSPHRLRSECPKCAKRLRIRGSVLGRSIRCPHCSGVFRADWAEVQWPS